MLDEMLQRIHRTCAILVSITSKHDAQGHILEEIFALFFGLSTTPAHGFAVLSAIMRPGVHVRA